MDQMLRFLLLSNTFLMVFYIFFRIFLAQETRLNLNRLILNSGLILSVIFPLVPLDWMLLHQVAVIDLPALFTEGIWQQGPIMIDEVVVKGTESWHLSFNAVLTAIFSLGILFMTMRLAFSLSRILSWRFTKPTFRHRSLVITLIPEQFQAFSFLNRVYLPGKYDPHDAHMNMVLEHEKVHIRQLHSLDIIMAEIFQVFYFYNPIIYLYKKQLQLNHEYLADRICGSFDRYRYSLNLMSSQFKVPHLQLVHSFNQRSLLKRRFTMLSKDKHKRLAVVKYFMLLPVLVGLLMFSASFNANGQDKKVENKSLSKEEVAKKAIEMEFIKAGFSKEDIRDYQNRLSYGSSFVENFNSRQMARNDIIRIVKNDGYAGLSEEEKKYKTLANEFKKSGKSEEVIIDILSNRLYGMRMGDDKSKELKQKEAADGGEVFFIVEEMPEFQGGDLEKFRIWVQDHITYPAIAMENGIHGTVYVNFVVGIDGKINNINIVRGVDPSLDDQVIKTIKNAPAWIPGKQRGKAVAVSMAIPVRFTLQ